MLARTTAPRQSPTLAGCRFVATARPARHRLRQRPRGARAVAPVHAAGSVPDVTWVQEASRFMLDAGRGGDPPRRYSGAHRQAAQGVRCYRGACADIAALGAGRIPIKAC